MKFRQLIRLNSAMWFKGVFPYIPISLAGSKLTPDNMLQKLKVMSSSNLLVRVMKFHELGRQNRFFLNSKKNLVPLGLSGRTQLVVYDQHGKVDEEKTHRRYRGHHKPDSSEHVGFGLSFSAEYSIYCLMGLVTGNSSLVFADPTALPKTHVYDHCATVEEPIRYEPDGMPSVHTFEHEHTIQDIPSILMPLRMRRIGLQVVCSANPYFIDMQNPDIAKEMHSKVEKIVRAFSNLSTQNRTGKPIPGMGPTSPGIVFKLMFEAITQNMRVTLEILEMHSSEKDRYYRNLLEFRRQMSDHINAIEDSYRSIEVRRP